MYRFLLFLCFAVFINALPVRAMANSTVIKIDGSLDSLSLGKSVEYWVDHSGKFTLEQVRTLPESAWIAGTEEDLSFGFTEQAHWLRLTIENQSDQPLDALLEIGYAPIDDVTFHVLEHGVLVDRQQAGDRHSFSHRPIFHRNHMLPLSLDASARQTVFIRLQTQGSLIIPLTLRSLSNYNVHEQYYMALQGAFFGIMLIMALYNLVLYTAIKDASYLYYVAAVLSFGFFNASLQGTGFQFLWPENPELNYYALPFFMLLSGMTTYAFSIRFLRLKEHHRIYYRACVVLLITLSSIVVAMFTRFFNYNEITKVASIISSSGALFLLITAVHLFAKGHSTVRFYLLAFVCLFLAMLLLGLEKFAVIPAHPMIDYSMQIGNTLQVLLLSFALTDRISYDRKKRHQMEKIAIEADANNKAKSDFLATMSHEIRTPLNGVLGMTELLRGTRLESQQQHYLNVISSSGKALLYLINDILDYSKIEAGKMDVELIDIDLDELVLECASIFNAEAQRKGILLLVSREQDVPSHIKSDANRIRQILINLIGNALKFTSAGSIKVTVMKTESGAKPGIRFDVQDTGIGLTKEQQEKLFTPYSQAGRSTSRQFGGTGLGLSISKKLSELLGGEIGVTSVPGEGSLFWFSVEYHEVDNKDLLSEVAIPPALNDKRVLLADESKEYVKSVGQGINQWGLDTTTVTRADEVLEELTAAAQADRPFDLIVISSTLAQAVSDAISNNAAESDVVINTPMIALSETVAIMADENSTELRIIKMIQKPVAARALKGDITEALLGATGAGSEHSAAREVNDISLADMGTIIVAEDNSVNQMVIKGMLRRMDAAFEVVNNGAEAVTLFKEKQQDIFLILMDCEMPVLDGFEATHAIRQLEKDAGGAEHVPIVALSAHATREFRDRALDSGMDAHLSKPIQYEVLKDFLEGYQRMYSNTRSSG